MTAPITIQGGINIGGGISIGAGSAPIPPGGTTQFNTLYDAGGGLSFPFGGLTVLDNYAGEYSTISTFQMTPGNKYMISYHLDYYTDPISWIGVANSSVDQYNGLGYDSNSIGFNSVGDYRFGGTVYGTGYCNFTNVGDIIDLAVDTSVNLMWIRVNGGNWNNSPSGNPATQSNGLAIGGINNGYFGLSVGGTNFYSQFTIESTAAYSVPSGFTFIAGA